MHPFAGAELAMVVTWALYRDGLSWLAGTGDDLTPIRLDGANGSRHTRRTAASPDVPGSSARCRLAAAPIARGYVHDLVAVATVERHDVGSRAVLVGEQHDGGATGRVLQG